MSNLYRLVGELSYANLIAGNYPTPAVGVRMLRRLNAEATYPMGTILAESARDKMLVILGTNAQAEVIEVLAVKGKYTITITVAGAEGDTLKLTVGGLEKTYTVEDAAGQAWPEDNIAGDCSALKALIAADFTDYDVTNTATTVVLQQKTGRTEDEAVILVAKAAGTGTLEAAVVENTEGVSHVAPLPLEVLTPSYVLAEDTTIGVAAGQPAPVFSSGCFAPENVTVGLAHTITDAEKDELRKRNIVFKSSYHD